MAQLILTLFGFYGIISNDTTWSDTAYLTGDVLVQPGVTLTIAPGTVVLYADTYEWDTAWYVEGETSPRSWWGANDLMVEGNLKAVGSVADSIYFRSLNEDDVLRGIIILANGWDSLCFNSIIGSSGWDSRMFIYNSETYIADSRIEKNGGITGKKSLFVLKRSNLSSNYSMVKLERGFLQVEDCSFTKGYGIISYEVEAVLMGKDLDSCKIMNSSIRDGLGYSPDVINNGGDYSGCAFFSCGRVEISNCIIDSIRGGWGGREAMGASPGAGGSGFGIILVDCGDAMIDKNAIVNILGGGGGWGTYGFGPNGASRPFVCYSSSPTITSNEFNSEGTYIYIDSTSHPVIGGAPGAGNHFLNAADRNYVIYNSSPYDIDATWNFWECSPSLIDSLIYDHYDNPQKGIVHYDHATGVGEEPTSPHEPFAIASTIVHDVLSISLPQGGGGGTTIALYDVAGRRVKAETISRSPVEINVSGLSRGVYFIQLRAGERAANRKIIVK